jgi:hypothetical protein
MLMLIVHNARGKCKLKGIILKLELPPKGKILLLKCNQMRKVLNIAG